MLAVLAARTIARRPASSLVRSATALFATCVLASCASEGPATEVPAVRSAFVPVLATAPEADENWPNNSLPDAVLVYTRGTGLVDAEHLVHAALWASGWVVWEEREQDPDRAHLRAQVVGRIDPAMAQRIVGEIRALVRATWPEGRWSCGGWEGAGHQLTVALAEEPERRWRPDTAELVTGVVHPSAARALLGAPLVPERFTDARPAPELGDPRIGGWLSTYRTVAAWLDLAKRLSTDREPVVGMSWNAWLVHLTPSAAPPSCMSPPPTLHRPASEAR